MLIGHHAVVINVWLETAPMPHDGHVRKICLETGKQAGGVRFELLGSSAGEDPLGGVQDDYLQLDPIVAAPAAFGL
jgi:hypothetical protein